jgi:hypothetical protein
MFNFQSSSALKIPVGATDADARFWEEVHMNDNVVFFSVGLALLVAGTWGCSGLENAKSGGKLTVSQKAKKDPALSPSTEMSQKERLVGSIMNDISQSKLNPEQRRVVELSLASVKDVDLPEEQAKLLLNALTEAMTNLQSNSSHEKMASIVMGAATQLIVDISDESVDANSILDSAAQNLARQSVPARLVAKTLSATLLAKHGSSIAG